MLKDRIRALLTSDERRLFSKLDSPIKIQNFLESIPTNYELRGETNYSPRNILRHKTAHCFEGAVFAATALAYHGKKPLLMDFATTYDDEDHAVALFREHDRWGAISKTNHAILRYRDPVYETPRELAMSYFHEYFLNDGRKSLRGFSKPFDLSRFPPERWVTTEEPLEWLLTKIAQSRYVSIAPESFMRRLRRATKIELQALLLLEHQKS